MNSIPVIGKLFGNRTKKTDEQEVVISITPRIVRGAEADRGGHGRDARRHAGDPAGRGRAAGAVRRGRGVAARPAPSQAPAAGHSPGASPQAPTGQTNAPAPNAEAGRSDLAPMSAAPQGPPAGVAGAAAATTTAGPGTPADARPVTVLFSPPEASLRAGQTAGVAVVLVGARDVQWVEVIVGFDPALAEVTDVSPGSLLTLDGTPVSAERQIEAGRARVRFLRPTAASGSGAVAAITLRGLKPGSGTFAIESIAVGHAGGTERPAPPAPARLVVTP